jgi:hypothetical protein
MVSRKAATEWLTDVPAAEADVTETGDPVVDDPDATMSAEALETERLARAFERSHAERSRRRPKRGPPHIV